MHSRCRYGDNAAEKLHEQMCTVTFTTSVPEPKTCLTRHRKGAEVNAWPSGLCTCVASRSRCHIVDPDVTQQLDKCSSCRAHLQHHSLDLVAYISTYCFERCILLSWLCWGSYTLNRGTASVHTGSKRSRLCKTTNTHS